MYQDSFSKESPIGRDCFCDIIDRHNLKVRLKRRKPRTTDSTHGLPTYPNIVREFIPTAANQLWVSDITYIVITDSDTHYHFCYLSLILDAFTEEIIGWSVGPTLDTLYSMEALKIALKRIEENSNIGLIHHSDRGSQYASNDYVRELQSHSIQISMTERGDPKDNAQAERINNTMKNELLKDKVFKHIDEVVAAVSVAVDFYNNERPHLSIGMLIPVKAANLSGDRDMKWRSYRFEAINKKQLQEIPEICLPLPPCQGLTEGRSPEGGP
jgi:transposase InsO family protein